MAVNKLLTLCYLIDTLISKWPLLLVLAPFQSYQSDRQLKNDQNDRYRPAWPFLLGDFFHELTKFEHPIVLSIVTIFLCFGYAGRFILEKDRRLFNFRQFSNFLTQNRTILPGQIGQQFSHLRRIAILDGTNRTIRCHRYLIRRILKSDETGQNQNLELLWIDYCINSWTGKIILVKSPQGQINFIYQASRSSWRIWSFTEPLKWKFQNFESLRSFESHLV